jgi:2-amino-4-hydroxy-6-hydroxymethyldihydropteridine diphosphokinase
MSTTVYIGLGSNMEDPVAQLKHSLDALATHPDIEVTAVSRFYRNPPMGPQDQPDYVNAAARLETGLEPEPLLDALQSIENAQGRDRNERHWGPRTLDLDILLYDELFVDTERLTIPHPGIVSRPFVLQPLSDIDPDLVIPGHGSVKHLLEHCDTYWLEVIDG